MLPSLGQHKLQSPGASPSGSIMPEYWCFEAIQQRQASVNKKDVDAANLQIRPMKEQDVHTIAIIDSVYFGAPRPEYYGERLGSATNGPGINAFWVAEALTSISQVDCKG